MSLSITGMLFPLKLRCPVCAKKNRDFRKTCTSCGHVFTAAEVDEGMSAARTRCFKYGAVLCAIMAVVFLLQLIQMLG